MGQSSVASSKLLSQSFEYGCHLILHFCCAVSCLLSSSSLLSRFPKQVIIYHRHLISLFTLVFLLLIMIITLCFSSLLSSLMGMMSLRISPLIVSPQPFVPSVSVPWLLLLFTWSSLVPLLQSSVELIARVVGTHLYPIVLPQVSNLRQQPQLLLVFPRLPCAPLPSDTTLCLRVHNTQ